MLKTEIGREQLDFVSDNLSANFNAYFRIFIFLSSISKSPHPPTHPRRNIFEKTSSDTSFTLDNPNFEVSVEEIPVFSRTVSPISKYEFLLGLLDALLDFDTAFLSRIVEG